MAMPPVVLNYLLKKFNMLFEIVRNDITQIWVGAIVNPTNRGLAPGGDLDIDYWRWDKWLKENGELIMMMKPARLERGLQ